MSEPSPREAVISDVLGVQSSQREARLSALTILMQTAVVCSWCLARDVFGSAGRIAGIFHIFSQRDRSNGDFAGIADDRKHLDRFMEDVDSTQCL